MRAAPLRSTTSVTVREDKDIWDEYLEISWCVHVI